MRSSRRLYVALCFTLSFVIVTVSMWTLEVDVLLKEYAMSTRRKCRSYFSGYSNEAFKPYYLHVPKTGTSFQRAIVGVFCPRCGYKLLREIKGHPECTYKYAWIPQARLEDFREGLRKKTVDRSYFLKCTEVVAQTEGGNDDLPGQSVNTRDRWLCCEEWHCECGPGSTQLSPDEMIASSMRAQARRSRMSKVHTGRGKKVGCPACFVVRYPNPSCFQSVVPGGPSIEGFVRVAWKLVGHSAACDEVL